MLNYEISTEYLKKYINRGDGAMTKMVENAVDVNYPDVCSFITETFESNGLPYKLPVVDLAGYSIKSILFNILLGNGYDPDNPGELPIKCLPYDDLVRLNHNPQPEDAEEIPDSWAGMILAARSVIDDNMPLLTNIITMISTQILTVLYYGMKHAQ